MLTLTFNNCQRVSLSIQGGASNGFVINELAFEDIKISACGPVKGPRAEVVLHIHPIQEAGEIINEVRAAIRDWRQTAVRLHVPAKVLEPYSRRWDQ